MLAYPLRKSEVETPLIRDYMTGFCLEETYTHSAGEEVLVFQKHTEITEALRMIAFETTSLIALLNQTAANHEYRTLAP